MKPSILWAASAVLALACATQTAHAGPKDDDLKARRAQAAQLHAEGATFYERGSFDAARGKFHEAFARSQNPNSLFNEARSAGRGGHALDAANLLKAYLALPENDKVTAQDRKEAEGLLDEAMGKLCSLDVRVTKCTVDGKEHAGAVLVEIGAHEVKMNGPQGERTKTVMCKAREVVVVTYDEAPTGPKGNSSADQWLLPATLAGLGVIGLGVGIGLGAASGGSKSDAIAASRGGACAELASATCREARSQESTANTLATGSVIGYVGGGVFLLASAISVVALKPWRERNAQTQVRITPALGGLWIDGTF